MAFEWLMTGLPAAGTIGGAAVSILAAVGTAWLAYNRNKSLEGVKKKYQAELENTKNTYQRELEDLKTRLQTNLEVRKSELQTGLEERKAQLQANMEDRKLVLQKELAEFNADLTDVNAAKNARRVYEYDARRRLYGEVEPLLFQLFDAAEGAFHAVASLARTQRDGDLPEWLGPDARPYYIRSIIHRLFRPLGVYRLVQRSTTLVDLTLDPTIRLRYRLLKECYLTWTDDFGIAELAPKKTYKPFAENWQELRLKSPEVHWRQGFVIGHLDRLVDAMAVSEGTKFRVMNFGEFDAAVEDDAQSLKGSYIFASDIFKSFSFTHRPVLARVLLSYAGLMYVLMMINAKAKAEDAAIDPAAIFDAFLASDDSKILNWHKGDGFDELSVVESYVRRRIEQAQQDYVRF